MAQQTINAGPPYSGAGDLLAVGWAKTNANFGELYSLTSKTLNAADPRFAAGTIEGSINNAINMPSVGAVAVGAQRVVVPATMFPYDATKVTFSPLVQMVREGGDWTVYDVWAYGAAGNAVADDTAAIQAAITNASQSPFALQGGVVYFPPGKYYVSSTLVVPVAVNQNQVVLKGCGQRVSVIYGTGDSANFTTGIIRFGVAVPDPSGASPNTTQRCGMEELDISGSLLTGAGNAIAVQWTQMQKGWMRNVIIESMTLPGSIGLYLRGTTTVGVGSPAAFHSWRGTFINVIIQTSIRPLVIENGDENGFYGCNFAVQPGLNAGGPYYAIEIVQGYNNRFYDVLVSGDDNVANRPQYRGIGFDTPTKGSCIGLFVFGLMAEGFDYGVYIGSGTQDVSIYGYHESTCRASFYNGSDDGSTDAQRANNVHIYMTQSATGGVRDYHSGTLPEPEPLDIPAGTTTPSVAASNTFTCANTLATNITDFINQREGQTITIRFSDANTTLVNAFAHIRCPGGVNLVSANNLLVTLKRSGNQWWVTSTSQC